MGEENATSALEQQKEVAEETATLRATVNDLKEALKRLRSDKKAAEENATSSLEQQKEAAEETATLRATVNDLKEAMKRLRSDKKAAEENAASSLKNDTHHSAEYCSCADTLLEASDDEVVELSPDQGKSTEPSREQGAKANGAEKRKRENEENDEKDFTWHYKNVFKKARQYWHGK